MNISLLRIILLVTSSHPLGEQLYHLGGKTGRELRSCFTIRDRISLEVDEGTSITSATTEGETLEES